MSILFAGAVTLLFTTVLTIAGVGAAFILIPVFIALGIEIHQAMATALLLNAVAMTIATYRYMRKRLVVWRIAVPVAAIATVLSPYGAYVSRGMDRDVLLWMFVGFLLFAAGMMLFHTPRTRENANAGGRQMIFGLGIGAIAGFLGGLLGVGGGNFIIPVLVWQGMEPKKASATTSFVVIFSSLSGFLGHASLGVMNVPLVTLTTAGAALGAVIGSWLMTEKLKQRQVKVTVGLVLLGIAIKMAWSLLS